jgi:hypothetical protein
MFGGVAAAGPTSTARTTVATTIDATATLNTCGFTATSHSPRRRPARNPDT